MSVDIDDRIIRTRAYLRRCTQLTALAILAVVCTMVSSVATAGELDEVIQWDIKAGTLNQALLQFGTEANMQINFPRETTTATARTREIKGRYTARHVLDLMLSGLHYRYRITGDTISVQAGNAGRTVAGSKSHFAGEESARRGSRAAGDPADDSGQTHPGPLRAQLSEVIVTAQKFRQRAFDVPMSLDVITGQELQRLNITSLNGLQYDVSGLYVEGGTVSNYIVLRGVSNLAGNGALVGEYIDDADISAEGYNGQVGYGTGSVQLYDLNRVEVLKGPQGTLYGDGAMGGVIRYITNKPVLNKIEMGANVATLFTQYGAPSERIETMINVPLVSGSLGLRIAGQFEHDGGWVDEPAANLKNFNSVDTTDVRIEGLWRPTSRFRAVATEIVHRETYGNGAGEDSQGNITQAFGTAAPPTGVQSFGLSNLTLHIDLGAVRLLSSSTYLNNSQTTYNVSYIYTGGQELQSYFPLSNRSYSEELRLYGTKSHRWKWMVGAFIKHYREFSAAREYSGGAGSLDTATLYDFTGSVDRSDGRSVFADLSARLLKRLTVGAGVRYFRSGFTAVDNAVLVDGSAIVPPNWAAEHFSSTDPRVYLQYRLTPHINTYISAAKGFRSGEPNLGLFRGFNPESLWSYDWGTKTRLLQNRLHADADIFYERYSNYVGGGLVTVYGISEFGTFNIGAARIKGIDANVSWRPIRSWLLSAKGEVVDSRFVSVTAQDTGYLPGEHLPSVPPYTFVGSIQREFRWADKTSYVRLNYSETGPVEGGGVPIVKSDVIRLASLKIGVHWSSRLNLALFAQNLLNDRGYLDPYWVDASAYRPRPRTFGLQFGLALE